MCEGIAESMWTQYLPARWKEGRKEGRKEENVLFNDALKHFIYGYMALDLW